MVALRGQEYLAFVLQTPERPGVNNPVTIALEGRAIIVFRLIEKPGCVNAGTALRVRS